MEDSVLVIMGEWECTEFGRWRFRVSREEMARFVCLNNESSYKTLLEDVVSAFNVDEKRTEPCLSYLYETDTTAFTQGKMPPVSISGDVGLRRFINSRTGEKDMSIMLTLKRGVKCVGDSSGEGESNVHELRDTISDDQLVAHMELVESEMMAKRIQAGPTRCTSDEMEGSSDEEYDFDKWSELINKEYPPDWDPFQKGKRRKMNRFGGEDLGEEDRGGGQRKCPDLAACETRNGGQESGTRSGENIHPTTELVVCEDGYGNCAGGIGVVDNVGDELGCEMGPVLLTGGGSGIDDISTLNVEDEDIFVEDSLICGDAPPVRDNMRCISSDKANMDLRKAGDAIYVGKVFKDKHEFRKSLAVYAIKRLFHYKMGKSDKKRAIAICADGRCEWRVYATTHKNSENLEIRTVCLKHSCDVGTRSKYAKNASSEILAEFMKAKFANGKKGPRACEIPELMLSECNVTISYMKGWHAKEYAVSSARGTEEASYKFLATYLHLLKASNPGTISTIETTVEKDGTTPFKYLFFALGASIGGYKYLRKVVVIDGTQMKGKYKGCLVAASGQDGNAQIFPLGFGVIDGENEAGWEWFFRQLTAFVPDEKNLVFVSDRHAAIYSGLRKVYPLAQHGACTVHLLRNVKHRYKSDGLAKVVDNAARAYTKGDFGYWFDEVKRRRPACATYLEEIGFEHWSLAHFKGKRYNIMTSNIAESLNNALKKAVDYPIAVMVEFIRGKLMTWFFSRRKVAAKTMTKLTPEVEDQLMDHFTESTDCVVISASSWIYQVNDGTGCVFTVDLENRTCSCRVFDVLMIPCCHAIAAVAINGVDIHSLVGDCYSVTEWEKLYERVILPVPKEMDMEVPSDVKETAVKPPKTKRASGRPKKKIIPSQGEQTVSVC